jgi:hypothetical protein
MNKAIPGKAEVAVEYPDKVYIGAFEHSARYQAHLDETGVSLSLHHPGADDERKSVRIHLHYALFAEILRDLSASAKAVSAIDGAHREALRQAVKAFAAALDKEAAARAA